MSLKMSSKPKSVVTNPDFGVDGRWRIDPSLAAQWLALQRANRKLSRSIVMRYAGDMKAGNWLISGDTIRFNEAGHLVDGQHRLQAVIESGCTIYSYVAFGIDDRAVDVMDTGRKRRPADMLHRHGYSNCALLAASARWLLTIKSGLATVSARGVRPSNSEIKYIVERHPLLGTSAAICDHPKGMTPSMLTAIHYIGSHLLDEPAPEEADSFAMTFTKYISNSDYYPDPDKDPAMYWLRRLTASTSVAQRYVESALFNGSVYVWNKYVNHQDIPDKAQVMRREQRFDYLDLDKI